MPSIIGFPVGSSGAPGKPAAGTALTGNRGGLVVHAAVAALDDLVPRLVHEGISVRELTPVVSALESAFLALTEQEGELPADEQESSR